MVRKFRITCDREVAREIISELESLENSSVQIDENQKNLEGLVEVVSLIASISSVATNTFLIWSEKKKGAKEKVKIDEIQ